MSYDPYKILHVSYTSDLNTIREAFKRQAMLHHPDRGGNPYLFDMCKKAYNDIYMFKQQQAKHLQKESRNITQLKSERSASYGPSLNKHQQKSLERNFNQIFNNVRVETANDVGYGHMMDQSTGTREDNPQLQSAKRFNNKQLVVYEEPEPLPSLSENYEVLGEHKIKDFGQKSLGGIQYTDYMVAHADRELGNKPHDKIAQLENVRNRPQHKTVDQLRSERGRISYTMSPEDSQKYQIRKQQEEEMEEHRKMQFYQHVQNVEKKFNQIHNYLTN